MNMKTLSIDGTHAIFLLPGGGWGGQYSNPGDNRWTRDVHIPILQEPSFLVVNPDASTRHQMIADHSKRLQMTL